MRVVVLGAAGQLGREVVRILSTRGNYVRAAVRRSPVPDFGDSVEVRAVVPFNFANTSLPPLFSTERAAFRKCS